jgi:hypothetical protein
MQGENLDSEISLNIEIKFSPGNAGNDEILHSNHNSPDIVLLQIEEIELINTIKTSTHNRPPAINPEDNQWKIEKLIDKR